MKTKNKTKSNREQEIKQAYAILHKHKVSFITIEPNDFLQFPAYDCWKDFGIKPTKSNIERAMTIAVDYLNSEYFELIEDSISRVAHKKY
jgi:hypothetical protein